MMNVGGGAAAAVPPYQFCYYCTRPLSPEWIRAIRRKLIQVTISHPNHHYQWRAIAYARQRGLSQPYIDDVINTIAPHLANQLVVSLQHTNRIQGIHVDGDQNRKTACNDDIDATRFRICARNTTALCMQRVGIPAGQPNHTVYIPLYGLDINNHELNKVMAQVNQELNPFYLPNILENMAYHTHRLAHFVLNDSGHIFHTNASGLEITHDLNCTPVAIGNQLMNQYPASSDFTNGVNWVGNDPQVLNHLNMSDLSTPPPPQLRQLISSWIVNGETIPTPATIRARINTNRYDEQVAGVCRFDYHWPDDDVGYLIEHQGLHAIMPSNWLSPRYMASQPHHYEWQVREALRTLHHVGQIDSYIAVAAAHAANLQNRANALLNNLMTGPLPGLVAGNYVTANPNIEIAGMSFVLLLFHKMICNN